MDDNNRMDATQKKNSGFLQKVTLCGSNANYN
jgi:hypothetical protein